MENMPASQAEQGLGVTFALLAFAVVVETRRWMLQAGQGCEVKRVFQTVITKACRPVPAERGARLMRSRTKTGVCGELC
jgi:hypothetical protein